MRVEVVGRLGRGEGLREPIEEVSSKWTGLDLKVRFYYELIPIDDEFLQSISITLLAISTNTVLVAELFSKRSATHRTQLIKTRFRQSKYFVASRIHRLDSITPRSRRCSNISNPPHDILVDIQSDYAHQNHCYDRERPGVEHGWMICRQRVLLATVGLKDVGGDRGALEWISITLGCLMRPLLLIGG